jgi:glucose dehydrogenase
MVGTADAAVAMTAVAGHAIGARTFLVLGLLAWLGWLGFRAWALGSRPYITLGVVLALLLPALWTEFRWLSVQAAATTAVQQLAGDPAARVQCQRALGTFLWAGADLGRVEWDEPDRAWLTLETCQHLGSWLRSDHSAPTLDEAIAVHVLTHEAMHVAGDRNEATTECRALQHDARTVVLLGGTAEQGSALAQRIATDVYPRMSDEYRSSECRSGGALDHTPGDASWP